jgi:hypothetical protein
VASFNISHAKLQRQKLGDNSNNENVTLETKANKFLHCHSRRFQGATLDKELASSKTQLAGKVDVMVAVVLLKEKEQAKQCPRMSLIAVLLQLL